MLPYSLWPDSLSREYSSVERPDSESQATELPPNRHSGNSRLLCFFDFLRTKTPTNSRHFFVLFAPLLFCSLTLRVGNIRASYDPTRRIRLQIGLQLSITATGALFAPLLPLPAAHWQSLFTRKGAKAQRGRRSSRPVQFFAPWRLCVRYPSN